MPKTKAPKRKRKGKKRPKTSWSDMPWFKKAVEAAKDLLKKESEIKQMTSDEFFRLSRMLEDRHSIFYKFWEVGKPRFTYFAPTAAVTFNPDTGHYVSFIFNPQFWEWLGENVPDDSYSRLFVLSHEMLHLILRHGLRTKDCVDPALANVCLDIIVNHVLVDRFGFERDKVKGADKLCWVDTTFTNNPMYKGPPVELDKAFEYYYLLAKEHLPKSPKPGSGKGEKGEKGERGGKGEKGDDDGEARGLPELVDDHEGMSQDDIDELLEEMNEVLSNEEKEDIKDVLEDHCEDDNGGPDGEPPAEDDGDGGKGGKKRGCGSGGIWTFADTQRVRRKRKWETVIKKWAKKKAAQTFRDTEQWARIHRRFAGVADQLGDMSLPTEMEIDDKFWDEDQIDVWFFLDTSGSCAGLEGRFFGAAKTLPPDKFKIRLFCFNDNVYDVDIKEGKLNVGGGTSFDIMEAAIQQRMASENIKYPDSVFVITDGYGNDVSPQFPERWYWFMSVDARHCIPDKCHIFMLTDYE